MTDGARANNFDTLRFVAALAVLLSHACSLSSGQSSDQPLMTISNGQTTLGSIAVAVFFMISGYLIPQSFERSTPRRYIKARILRIMPALIVILLLLGLVLGPLITSVSLREYFSSKDFYKYLVINGSLLGFFGRLPGVFDGNPLHSVDGSLWTLRFEAECYVMVLILGVMGLLNRRVTSVLFVAGMIYLALEDQTSQLDFAEQDHRVMLFTQFFAGTLMHHWQVRLMGSIAALCAAVLVVTLLTDGFWIALNMLGAYVVVYVGKGLPFRLPDMARSGDLSYGIYIYHWPMHQFIITQMPQPEWWQTALLSTPLVLGFSYVSWHLVERPCLALKDRSILRPFALGQRLPRRSPP